MEIKNKEGTTIATLKGSRIMIARFPDMSEDIKNEIIELFIDFTGETPDRIRNFLDYKNEEFEFCS